MGDLNSLQSAIAKAMRVVPCSDCESADAERSANRRTRAERLRRSGCHLPDDERKAVLDGTIEQRHATRVVREWFEDPNRSAVLVISGMTGAGKTIAIGTLAADYDVHYVGADELCRIFSANFGEQLAKQDLIRETSMLLALDDVGSEIDEHRMLPTLLEILNARVSASKTPTLITTNDTKKTFGGRYDNQRLISRMARVKWVDVQGDDMRRKQ
jgi:DNA replication protein DnaC